MRYRDLRKDLVAANIGVTMEHYLLLAFLVSLLIGAACATAAFLAMQLLPLPQFSLGIYNVFCIGLPDYVLTDRVFTALHLLVSVVIFILAAYASRALALRYPAIHKTTRATRINLLLHNAVSYMYAMRQGGAEMVDIFRSLSENAGIYGEVADSSARWSGQDYFGCDLNRTQNLRRQHRQRNYRISPRTISVIESGGTSECLGCGFGSTRRMQSSSSELLSPFRWLPNLCGALSPGRSF